MSASQKLKTIAGIAVILTVLALAGVFSLEQLKKQGEARNWVTHTFQVINQLQVVLGNIDDLELAEQQYLLTNREVYFRQFNLNEPKITPLIGVVRDLTKDNPDQQLRIGRLTVKVDEKLNELKEKIDSLHASRAAQSPELVKGLVEKKPLDDVRSVIAEMMDMENQLLEKRTQVLEEHVKRTTFILVALIALAILLLLGMSGMIWELLQARQNALSEVQKSEKELADFFDNAVVALHWLSEEGIIIKVNAAECAMLGYAPDELVGKHVEKIHADKVKVDDILSRLRSHQVLHNYEAPLLCKDGSIKIAMIDSNVHFEGKKFIHTRSFTRDITAEKLAQTEAFQSESRFRQMAENIKEIFWITDAQGANPIYVSPAYESIYGRTIQSLYENPRQYMEATHPEDRDKLRNIVKRQMQVDYSCEIEYRILRPNDEVRWLWARLSTLKDEKGAFIGLCGVTNDITERKEVEKRVSEFYSVVSHELRTPLTSIRGSLGLIEGGRVGEIPPDAMQMIKIGRTESDRLIRLINDILDVKKVEAGQLELDLAVVEPRKLVTRTLKAIAGMASEAKVVIKNEVDTTYKVSGDYERLMQVLTNLISNAIKYSPVDQEVSVSVQRRLDDMLRFSVRDHGPGIPANKIQKLFGMFQQLDSSDSRRVGGTGLGLAISKSIVELHDGRIGVDSQEGDGSTFWFEIPIDRSSLKEDNLSVIKVLVVEPCDLSIEVLSEVFKGDQFVTTFAKTVGDAEKLLRDIVPDLILIDLYSNDGHGLDFLQGLKQSPFTKGIPVIVLSADGEKGGALSQPLLMEWIANPLQPGEIKSVVDKVLQRSHEGPATVLIVEDDPSTREVLRQQIGSLDVRCLEAGDGLQALDIARNQKISLIILDLGLPLMDGFEVIKVLREGNSKGIPLIVYTNRDLSKDDKKQLSLGLTNHLVKSRTTEEELIACVKDLLGRLARQTAG